MRRRATYLLVGVLLLALAGCVPSPTPTPVPTVSLDDCSYVGQAISSVDSALTDQFSRLDSEPLVVAEQIDATSKQFLSDTAAVSDPTTRSLVNAISEDFSNLVKVVKAQAVSDTGIDSTAITSAVSELQDGFIAAMKGCSNAQPSPSPTGKS